MSAEDTKRMERSELLGVGLMLVDSLAEVVACMLRSPDGGAAELTALAAHMARVHDMIQSADGKVKS